MKKFLMMFLMMSGLLIAGTTGKLVGVIVDADTKEPLLGANIILVGTNLGAASDQNGRFIILNITPGVYSVKASFVGYESVTVEGVKIIVDQTTNIEIEIKLKSFETNEVVITAKTPLIQKDLTSSISVVTRDKIEALPVSSFSDLLSLQAGVVGSGTSLHVRGGRANEVAYLVDGMYVKDPLLGRSVLEINNDAIQEMSLLSGTFNAEYGQALSAVVNIVTRDGSDDYSGKVEVRSSEFGIKRYADLNELRMNASLSGPLITKDVNFFISAELDKRGSYLPFGYSRLRTFFTKLSTTAIPSLKISLSNRGSAENWQTYNHDYKYIPEQYLKRKSSSFQSGMTLTYTVANNMFFDLRASYFNQGYYSGVNKDTSEYLASNEWEYFEQYGNGFEFLKRADPPELTDSRTVTADFRLDGLWQIGSFNEVKFGAAYKKHWLRYYNIYDPKRTFPYVNDYYTKPFEAAAYIQDKIELPYLIINLGLRFDYLNSNVSFRQNPLDPNSTVKVKSRSQLSPRIGIAHPISDKTKLHFAYGHFFQNPNYNNLFENKQYDYNVREPLFGQPNLDAERTIAYEVGIAHQFSDRIVMNLRAYYKDITGLIGTRYYFPYTDGRFTGYTLLVNEDYANVKGFEVTLDVRPDKYFSGGFTYTYSVAKGSASSELEQYPGTQESTQLYYLSFDRTHVFNANATYLIPEDEGPEIFGSKIFSNMDFSVVIRASSGEPYTPGGRDVGFVENNSLRQPGIYTIDLIFGKELTIYNNFQLRLFAEVLNLTDHRNILFVYRDTGEPDFTFENNLSDEYMKDPSNFGPPRSIRLGASIKF
ncbi:MAG: TonB-dependent receptor [Ignavibacteriaceae bacterium]|nr:TonB-dependent receptor [Ignavibacteriaceae bacterium]